MQISSEIPSFCENTSDLSFDEIARRGNAALESHLEMVPSNKGNAVLAGIIRFVKLLDDAKSGYRYCQLPPDAMAVWHAEVLPIGVDETLLCAILLDSILVGISPRAAASRIPRPFVKEYLKQLDRIAQQLIDGRIVHMVLNSDSFLKDLGICRMEIIPAKAQLVEKHSGIPRSLAFKGGIGQLLEVARLAFVGGFRFAPYLELHTHTPMIKSFNQAAWDSCYHLVAELLRSNENYQGLTGSSWFYDPEIERISPRLAYLRQRPLEGGACFLKVGSSQADIKNATLVSQKRLKLYEERKYSPTSYMMVWTRSKIIAWSDRFQ